MKRAVSIIIALFFGIVFVSANFQPVYVPAYNSSSPTFTNVNITVLNPDGSQYFSQDFPSATTRTTAVVYLDSSIPSGIPADRGYNVSVLYNLTVDGQYHWADNLNNTLSFIGRGTNFTGNITAPYYFGDGSKLSNLPTPIPYWIDLNSRITSNSSIDGGNVNVTGNLTVANTLSYAVPGGAYVYNIPISTANADGKYQYFSNYSTTTPAANKGFNIRTVDDFRGGSMVGVNSVGSSLDSRIEFPATGSGPWKYRGVSNLNTMNGNYVSGFAGAWTGDFIGFQTQTDITGKLATVAGFNMVAFNVIANITASQLPSTQLKTIKSDVYYNTPAAINQIYGWYHTVDKKNTSSTGSQHGFFTELANDGLGPINGPASAYTAMLNPAYAPTFNKSLGAGKMMNGFLVQQNNPYAMLNRETAAFHSELSQNATVYSFMSDGADGWMNKTGSMWMFGTSKGLNISFDGTRGVIAGNTAVVGNLNVTGNMSVGGTATLYTNISDNNLPWWNNGSQLFKIGVT